MIRLVYGVRFQVLYVSLGVSGLASALKKNQEKPTKAGMYHNGRAAHGKVASRTYYTGMYELHVFQELRSPVFCCPQ